MTDRERIEHLEAEVVKLNARLNVLEGKKDWRAVVGMFTGDEGMKELDEEVRRIREAEKAEVIRQIELEEAEEAAQAKRMAEPEKTDDPERVAADILLTEPDHPACVSGGKQVSALPDACPECGSDVVRPDGCCGSWTGLGPNDRRAGGGIYRTNCTVCGMGLVAYFDVYDDDGNLPDRPADWDPEVVWQRNSE